MGRFGRAVAVAFAAASAGQAEDVLISKRALNKRFIDSQGNYNISFYHVNDIHAHLDQFSASGGDCTSPERGCFGGYARIKTVVNQTRPLHPDSLFLDVGDESQGTMFYSYYGGEKIAQTLNQVGIDGMTLGNHEFDRGDNFLGAFLDNLTFPIISANIISSHPTLNATIKPYHIYEQYQLAVIGVTTDTTPDTSRPSNGTVFTDPVAAVQRTVDHIRRTTNITRIAAITHIGYDKDLELAEATTGLYLIMGGHTHTPLGNFTGAEGPYPTIRQNKDGEDVFIVTAYRWGEYLGYIDVTYDQTGRILAYHGGPIHLTNTTAQDPALQAQITQWREPFDSFSREVVGKSLVLLDQTTCQTQECLLGDYVSDAILSYRRNLTTDPVDFALVNAGVIRASIDIGNVTRGEVLTSFPFSNAIVDLPLTGAHLWDTLEGLVSGVNVDSGKEISSFFQVSHGIVIQHNATAELGSRLVSVTVGDSPLDRAAEYHAVTIEFVASGGDNILSPALTDIVTLDAMDEIFIDYIAATSPVNVQLEGRIVAV